MPYAARSDRHTHSAGRRSLCAGVQFLLSILYSLCVFQRVNVCMQNVCHSMWNEATSVSVCVCAQTPQFNFIKSVWTGFCVSETLWLKKSRQEGRTDGKKLKKHSDFPGCCRFCCFTTKKRHILCNRFQIFEEYMCCKWNKFKHLKTFTVKMLSVKDFTALILGFLFDFDFTYLVKVEIQWKILHYKYKYCFQNLK